MRKRAQGPIVMMPRRSYREGENVLARTDERGDGGARTKKRMIHVSRTVR